MHQQKFTIDPQDFFQEIDFRLFTRSVWRLRWRLLQIIMLAAVFSALCMVALPEKKAAVASLRIEPELSTAGELSSIDTEVKVVTSWPIIVQAVEALGYSAVIVRETSLWSRLLAPLRRVYAQLRGDSEVVTPSAEMLLVQRFKVPESLLNKTFTLVVEQEEGFKLLAPGGKPLFRSGVGTSIIKETAYGKLEIHVARLTSPPGTRYRITPVSTDKFVRQLQDQLVAERTGIRNSNGIIDVTMRSDDAGFALRFLNLLIDAYYKDAYMRSARGKIKILENLRIKNRHIEEKSRQAEQALENFRQQEKTINLNEESLNRIRLATELQGKIADLESQRAQLLATRTENHPSVLAVQDQIAAYASQLENQEELLARMPEIERQLFERTRDVEIYRKLFSTNALEINRLSNEIAGITGYVQILNRPILQKNPILLKVILGCIIGAALATLFSIAFILYRNIHFLAFIHHADMLRVGARMPVIASIPRSGGAQKGSYFLNRGENKTAEALADIEAKIKFIMHGAGNNILIFTSDVENQGKSFLASNFSLFSADNRRTLLIDADIVRGRLETPFGAVRVPGFSDLVVGAATIEEVVQKTVHPGLSFISAGTQVPSHSLLHDREKLAQIMQQLAQHFDLVVVDYPAVMSQIEDTGMLHFADTAFLVVRHGESAFRVKRFLAKYPEGLTKVSAILLNDVVE